MGYDDTAVGGDGGGAGSVLARSSNRTSPRSDRSRSSCWYAKRASGGGRDRDVAARSGARPGALPVLACLTRWSQRPLPTTSALLLRAGLLLAAGGRGVAAVIAQGWQRRPGLPQPCAQSRPVCGPKRTGRWRRAAAGVANNTRQLLHCESFALDVLAQRCLLSAGLRQARAHWPRYNGMPNFTWLAADGCEGTAARSLDWKSLEELACPFSSVCRHGPS